MADRRPEPLDDRPDLYIRRLYPGQMTFKDALEAAEMHHYAFEDDKQLHYINTPAYRYGNDLNVVRNCIVDPRIRLNAFIERAKAYKRLTYVWARMFHSRSIEDVAVTHGLYTVKKTTDLNINEYEAEVMVGYSMWFYPECLADKCVAEIRPTSCRGLKRLLYNMWARWLKIKYAVADFLTFFGYGGNPLVNEERDNGFRVREKAAHAHLYTEKSTVEHLSQASYDELVDIRYPKDRCIVLGWFLTHPSLQRQGVGYKFLSKSIDLLPLDPKTDLIEFESKDQSGKIHKSAGPQKYMIRASVKGEGLYKKLGYETVNFSTTEQDGIEFSSAFMEKLRL